MADRDDDLSWWDELQPPPREEQDSPPSRTGNRFGAYDWVQALFQQPLLGESAPAPAPTLRSAATELLRSSGLFGEASVAAITPVGIGGPIAAGDEQRPPSWKLPSRGAQTSILGDATAAGPGSSAHSTAPAPESDLPAPAPSAAPRNPASPAPASPFDHPDAQTGLALTAADALLTKGIDLAVSLAGGNPALARKLIEVATNTLAGVLPPEFRASALSSAEAAAAEAERRIGDNDRTARTRAALGTLANRRAEAEHGHAAAVLAGDRAKIEEARREALAAWRAERRARGDGEAEINATARALERDYRKTALRHRLAQMDSAGIIRALDKDEDAMRDPALAREVADDILRIRRDDPARAGQASVEREIAARKRDGRIDTPEEETAARYKLRLDAQAKRGVPEGKRRLLTNDERIAPAAEYLRIKFTQGKAAADAWLDGKAQETGPHAERFNAELASPQAARAQTESPIQIGKPPVSATQSEGAASAQETSVASPSRQQYAETPGSTSDVPADAPPLSTREREDRREADIAARAERHRAIVRAHLRHLAGPSIANLDALIGDILGVADTARAEDWSPARRYRTLLAVQTRIESLAGDNNRLRVLLRRGTEAAFDTRAEVNVEDSFIKGVGGVSPEDRARAEIAKEDERDRRERQSRADKRYSAFKGRQLNADYAETLSEIVRIAGDTGALPSGALSRLMPDLAPSREDARRLADPEKTVAQLDALRTVAKDEATARALPKSLRDLAADYDAVARDADPPRDPDQLVRAVLQRGAPRRLRQLGEIAETGAEIFTPWGNVVSLDDALKSAQQAYGAFAAGRTWEGIEQSGDALWFLAMAAPIIGNARRGAKAARGKTERAGTLKQNRYNAKVSEQIAEAAIIDAFKDYRVIIKPQRLEDTPIGATRPDIRASRDVADKRLFSIEVKDGDARQKRSQRERQAVLGKTYLMRVYRSENRMTIDGIPAQEWFAAMRRKLDRMGLRKE